MFFYKLRRTLRLFLNIPTPISPIEKNQSLQIGKHAHAHTQQIYSIKYFPWSCPSKTLNSEVQIQPIHEQQEIPCNSSLAIKMAHAGSGRSRVIICKEGPNEFLPANRLDCCQSTPRNQKNSSTQSYLKLQMLSP